MKFESSSNAQPTNAQPTPISSRRLARARERAALLGAPLLANSLQEYAAREKLSWSELAARLGGDENALNAAALCRPPREEYFVADTKAIAGDELDWKKLLPVLREAQVLQAFAAPGSDDSMLLAARDYDETSGEDSTGKPTGKNHLLENNDADDD